LISDRAKYKELIEIMEMKFNQLDELGLITFNRVANWTNFKMDTDLKPEIIFLFANHNPRSSKLSTILNNPAIDAYNRSPNFDLKFYVSSFAGYALHADSMVSLSQFRELLKKKNAERIRIDRESEANHDLKKHQNIF
jgi:hypothetical protein